MLTIKDIKEKNLLLFEVISGSKAFGLATEKSDTDIRGVYYLSKEDFFGLDYIPQVSNETNDEVYYELGRFVELLLKNNPNILEVLATPEDCILYKHPLMDQLKIEDFLSKLCKETFAGYASTQIQKARGLKKKIVNPMEKERKTILDFCTVFEDAESRPLNDWLSENSYHQSNCGLTKMNSSKGMFALYYNENRSYNGICKSEDSNEISSSSIPQGETVKIYVYFNQDAYSIYCKDYRNYWTWVEERNNDRYETNEKHGKNYDSKNMMHTIRLLESAVRLFETGKLSIRVENREELLAIKNGNWEYDDLLKYAEQLVEKLEKASINSLLQELPNKEKVNATLVSLRQILYTST